MIKTSFINVDLELLSNENLLPIAEELKGKVFLLTNEYIDSEYNLAFECSTNEEEPLPVIEKFITILNSLSPKSKKLLKTCSKRIFDIGYDSGEDGFISNSIPCSLLSEIVDLGFELKITVYQLDKGDG